MAGHFPQGGHRATSRGVTVSRYVLTPPGEPTMTWECRATDPDMARFLFVREWGGMVVSRDIRPSEIDVRKVSA